MLARAETSNDEWQNDKTYPFKSWYGVLIRAGKERDAADGFRRENVLAYWPNYNRHVAAGGRKTKTARRRCVLAAIMPGYIFTPASESDVFWPVAERIPGYINVLRGFNGEISIIQKPDIDLIREIEAGQNLPPPIKPKHTFKTGQKVRFTDDLIGRWPPGVVEKLLPDGRISVDVYLMARIVPILAFPHQLEPM